MGRAPATVWLLLAAWAVAGCADPERGPARGPQGRSPNTAPVLRKAHVAVVKPDAIPPMQPLPQGPVVLAEPPASPPEPPAPPPEPPADPPCEAQPVCRRCPPVTLEVTGTGYPDTGDDDPYPLRQAGVIAVPAAPFLARVGCRWRDSSRVDIEELAPPPPRTFDLAAMGARHVPIREGRGAPLRLRPGEWIFLGASHRPSLRPIASVELLFRELFGQGGEIFTIADPLMDVLNLLPRRIFLLWSRACIQSH